MKSIIFCEGKTDAILLSYYLENVAGWKFNKKLNKKIELPIRNLENEEVNVYTKSVNELVIWAVGGQNNFTYAVSQIIKLNKNFIDDEIYAKLIVLRDHDLVSELDDILNEFNNLFEQNEIDISIKNNNEWTKTEYINAYDEKSEMHFLPVIVPVDKYGALETFVLDAICEMGQEEKMIVSKSKEFISGFNLRKYLNSQRLKVKGEFSVTLGTMFPQKTFTPIDEMLKNISWERYSTIQSGFKKLEEI